MTTSPDVVITAFLIGAGATAALFGLLFYVIRENIPHGRYTTQWLIWNRNMRVSFWITGVIGGLLALLFIWLAVFWIIFGSGS